MKPLIRTPLSLGLLLTSASLSLSLSAAGQSGAFDGAATLPSSWLTGVTGQGKARWEVVAERSAASAPNVLRQSGVCTYCWAVDRAVQIQNGFVEVSIRPVSGSEDQAGGLVWRFRDAGNYYVVRANALEDNVVLYKTVNGKRSSLQIRGRMFGYGVDAAVPRGTWSTLRVDFSGNLFTVSWNGKQLFQVEDSTFGTPGAVGVWTKADSVTEFDNFTSGTKEPPR